MCSIKKDQAPKTQTFFLLFDLTLWMGFMILIFLCVSVVKWGRRQRKTCHNFVDFVFFLLFCFFFDPTENVLVNLELLNGMVFFLLIGSVISSESNQYIRRIFFRADRNFFIYPRKWWWWCEWNDEKSNQIELNWIEW